MRSWATRLGLRCGSFDLAAGCAGFVYELVAGAAMLTAGGLDHVLVIGAETLSRIVDPTDRGTCIIFGDAAAALVLEATPDDGPGILGWDLGCDGSAAGLLEVQAGGSRLARRPRRRSRPASSSSRCRGRRSSAAPVRAVVDSAGLALEHAGVAATEIDWFVPHQANVRIIEAAANRLKIPMDRTVVNIDRFGNTSAASIPLALAGAADDGRITDGDLVLLSGFGAGMTWGSVVVRWGRG